MLIQLGNSTSAPKEKSIKTNVKTGAAPQACSRGASAKLIAAAELSRRALSPVNALGSSRFQMEVRTPEAVTLFPSLHPHLMSLCMFVFARCTAGPDCRQ